MINVSAMTSQKRKKNSSFSPTLELINRNFFSLSLTHTKRIYLEEIFIIIIYSIGRERERENLGLGCGRGIPEPLITRRQKEYFTESTWKKKRKRQAAVTTFSYRGGPTTLFSYVGHQKHTTAAGFFFLSLPFSWEGEGKEVCFWVIMLVHLASLARAYTRRVLYGVDTQCGKRTPPQRH